MDVPFVLRKAKGRRQLAAAESGPDAGRHVMPRDASDERLGDQRERQCLPAAPGLGEDEHAKLPQDRPEGLQFHGGKVVKNQVPHGDARLLRAECLINISCHPPDPPVQSRRSGNKIQAGDGAAWKSRRKAIAEDSFSGSQLDDARPGRIRMEPCFAENPFRSAKKPVQPPQVVPAADGIWIQRVQ